MAMSWINVIALPIPHELADKASLTITELSATNGNDVPGYRRNSRGARASWSRRGYVLIRRRRHTTAILITIIARRMMNDPLRYQAEGLNQAEIYSSGYYPLCDNDLARRIIKVR
ncbi:hypothetical protein HZH68_007181 [Vespula germanica]|uniref:Uncharacterized protein n=1 Tax=Vespula germanica TaxID=30212 RepID=A0A834K760_VESGE|nr:hypothetical protein HZH68_007181 [Vespula germanica]